jgi:isocitrate/isopropylmalate dehydrogenase
MNAGHVERLRAEARDMACRYGEAEAAYGAALHNHGANVPDDIVKACDTTWAALLGLIDALAGSGQPS